ncbi:hypothetical protein GXW78_16040 [Roseomonas terrae]|uniref:Uncharacterized protein n=1 Tax=Neoroseomonas terrae TaxID=424799 RepID=A0ABS5EJH8_9PROT|nr:hypothetical protein [Neoroseomonas terrae]MBR0651184.1 hypothetical protein [Neoroseomonas terrae]
MSKTLPWAEPTFTFAEVLTVVGTESAWLRTLLQRDKDGRLGTKHRTGRLLFALKDVVGINVLWQLNTTLRMAPAAAWEVVESVYWVIGNAKKADGTKDRTHADVRIAFDSDGGVLVWTVRDDGRVITWNDNATEKMSITVAAERGPRIVFPMSAIMAPFHRAVQLWANWPEAGAEADEEPSGGEKSPDDDGVPATAKAN